MLESGARDWVVVRLRLLDVRPWWARLRDPAVFQVTVEPDGTWEVHPDHRGNVNGGLERRREDDDAPVVALPPGPASTIGHTPLTYAIARDREKKAHKAELLRRLEEADETRPRVAQPGWIVVLTKDRREICRHLTWYPEIRGDRAHYGAIAADGAGRVFVPYGSRPALLRLDRRDGPSFEARLALDASGWVTLRVDGPAP